MMVEADKDKSPLCIATISKRSRDIIKVLIFLYLNVEY